MRRTVLVVVLLLGLSSLQGHSVLAEVKPHGLISDGMVLQRGMSVPIWGTAAEGEQVTVSFQNQEVSATAKDGQWLVRLENLTAGGPFELTIAGQNTIQVKNVLVGEVWVCSGQSNMAMTVQGTANAQQAIADSQNPMIHLFTVPRAAADQPAHDVKGSWRECGPDTVPRFSAVGYFFGLHLQKALNVPVGLINSSVGGTAAESWTSRPALEAEPALKDILDNYARALERYPEAMEKYNQALEKYKQALEQAKREGTQRPRRPYPPMGPTNMRRPSGLYNAMIASLQPYAIRGVIWYQGEANAGRAFQYRTLLPTMIRNWRQDWGEGDFPFLIVELAPFTKISPEPQESAWAELREAQLLTAKTVPNTAVAVITDVGEEDNIHPKHKEPVGARLALAARAIAYGEKIVYSGPIYDSMKVDGNKVILTFKHVGGGLVCKGEKLTGFTIAGEDRKFVNAQAQIQGDKVVVSSPEIDKPVAVRFGWANYPVVNLWNKDGLPAAPFRTDSFPMITQPKEAPAGG